MCIRDRYPAERYEIPQLTSDIYVSEVSGKVVTSQEDMIESALAVSYTHLDVSKRQEVKLKINVFLNLIQKSGDPKNVLK